MGIIIGNGSTITGSVISDGSGELRVNKRGSLESLLVKDNVVRLSVKEGTKVFLNGQKAPRRCCGNCALTDVKWCTYLHEEIDYRDDGCIHWEADE